MIIVHSYFDGLYNYDCAKCGGMCCNVNTNLIFNKDQVKGIKNFEVLSEYTLKKGNSVQVNCGKKCWFLNDRSCGLSEKEKPIGCELYPVNFWKMADEIVVAEIIPCPTLKFDNKENITYDRVENRISTFNNWFGINKCSFVSKILEINPDDLKNKIFIYEQWKKKLFSELQIIEQDSNITVLRSLVTQIIIHPIVYNLDKNKWDVVKKIYNSNLLKIEKTQYGNNLYSMYALARNQTLKEVLFKNYFPCNKKTYEELSENNKELYLNIYKGIGIEKEKIFDLFYNKKGTIWKVV